MAERAKKKGKSKKDVKKEKKVVKKEKKEPKKVSKKAATKGAPEGNKSNKKNVPNNKQAEKKYSKKSGKTDISKINIKKLDRRSIRKRKGKLRKCRRNPPKKGSKLRGEKRHVFYIDCSQPVDDDIFDMASFEQFLKDSIKVAGKKGQLGEAVEVTRTTSKVSVSVNIRFQKRYLKYLTKKFLKKQSLRDYIRVIANAKDSYYLRYFNINQAGGDDDDE